MKHLWVTAMLIGMLALVACADAISSEAMAVSGNSVDLDATV